MLLNKKPFSAEQIGVFSGLVSLFLYLIGTSSFFIYFSFFLTPLFLVYLTQEIKSSSIAYAILLIGIFFYQPFFMFVSHFITYIIPAFVLGFMSQRYIKKGNKIWWYPESLLLKDISYLSMFIVFFLSVFILKEDHITQVFNDWIEVFKNIYPKQMLQNIKQVINSSVGIFTFINILFVLINFKIAYKIAKSKNILRRKKFDFYHIKLPTHLALFPMVIFLILKIFPNESFVITGLFIASLIAPFLNGISIIHCFADGNKQKLILFYTFLILINLTLPSIIVLGIIDSFIKIRRFIK